MKKHKETILSLQLCLKVVMVSVLANFIQCAPHFETQTTMNGIIEKLKEKNIIFNERQKAIFERYCSFEFAESSYTKDAFFIEGIYEEGEIRKNVIINLVPKKDYFKKMLYTLTNYYDIEISECSSVEKYENQSEEEFEKIFKKLNIIYKPLKIFETKTCEIKVFDRPFEESKPFKRLLFDCNGMHNQAAKILREKYLLFVEDKLSVRGLTKIIKLIIEMNMKINEFKTTKKDTFYFDILNIYYDEKYNVKFLVDGILYRDQSQKSKYDEYLQYYNGNRYMRLSCIKNKKNVRILGVLFSKNHFHINIFELLLMKTCRFYGRTKDLLNEIRSFKEEILNIESKDEFPDNNMRIFFKKTMKERFKNKNGQKVGFFEKALIHFQFPQEMKSEKRCSGEYIFDFTYPSLTISEFKDEKEIFKLTLKDMNEEDRELFKDNLFHHLYFNIITDGKNEVDPETYGEEEFWALKEKLEELSDEYSEFLNLKNVFV